MGARTGIRRLILLLTAVGGVVAAHAIGYAAVLSDGGERARYLHSTGHGYWAAAVALGTGGTSLAIGLTAWFGLRSALMAGGRATRPILGFAPLVVAQVGLYAGLEVGERLLGGSDVGGMVHTPLFAVGVVLQVVVAAFAVLLLRLIASGCERVADRLRRRTHRTPLPIRLSTAARLPATVARGAAGCRGPPHPLHL